MIFFLQFVQSDDHQVVRTRYPAMRHDCGDIIRPGDCVLLRAGSKKNELPYVAKVASLWENPEDGMYLKDFFPSNFGPFLHLIN